MAVKQQRDLQELDLSFNNLEKIALGLTELTKLERLNLANNTDLTAVPVLPASVVSLDLSGTRVKLDGTDATICLNPRLVDLGLAAMQLPQIPASVLPLSELRRLCVSNNGITSLTAAEAAAFPALEVLDLSGNPLTTLAPSIGSLGCLRELRLSQTRLAALPAEMAQLTQLEVLDLRMTELETFDVNMSRMARLRELLLCDSRLRHIGPAAAPSFAFLQALETLDLSRNMLEALPRQVGYLRSLRKLDVQSNQLRTLPGELMFLNTASLDINVNKNPFCSPFAEWIHNEGILGTLAHLAPFCAAYPPACTISRELTSVAARTPVEFRVQAADYKGNPRTTGKDPFAFTITRIDGPTAGTREECFIKDNHDKGAPGTYDCFFNIAQPGTYECAVTMDGTNISGSPFVITCV